LKEEWGDFDAYLGAMTSKYRVRARRARKKGISLERREMQLEELEDRQQQMFAYYQGIARQSDFNTVVLPANYFVEWKRQFADHFKVWGYFKEENFVGFSTAIYNDHELEAHFLGFDQSYNSSHQLYLNMLYDLVTEAIASSSRQLVFSRTALEIKSSVGAVPQDLQCWVRSRVGIAKPLVPIVARFIAPLPNWVQRHPFK
ncbi:MAG: GNAT family N-acetyltransferase, partial [Bacteroidota bacterium]